MKKLQRLTKQQSYIAEECPSETKSTSPKPAGNAEPVETPKADNKPAETATPAAKPADKLKIGEDVNHL